jgi:hypothetical protein
MTAVRSWSQGAGSPGIDAHQAWPAGGRESSQSHDDDSSSQARGSQIQAGNGIVTHRIKIGLAMNSSSTISAEVPSGSRSMPGWKSPPSRSSPPRPAVAGHPRPAWHRRRASAAAAWTRGRRARQRAEHRADLALRAGALPDPAREVTDFPRRACQIVPDGQESGHIDLDAELNDLLRQAS